MNKDKKERKNNKKKHKANLVKEFASNRIKKDEALLYKHKKYFVGFDRNIILLVIALSIFGILMVYSASYYTTTSVSDNPYYYLTRQTFWVLSGLAILFFLANIDYHKYYKYADAMIAISILALLMVAAFGISVNGAKRWLGFGTFRITPSECTKFFVIIWTSTTLAQKPERIRGLGLVKIMMVMFIHAFLIFEQPNLSTAIVVCIIMLAIMFVAGLHPGWIAGMVGVIGSLCLFIVKFMPDSHWYSRMVSFLDPFADSQGDGYQVVQSLIALGNGGITGLGFSKGISKNLYLPEPQNDFILAVIGEEFGYIGFLILMVVYFLLLSHLIRVALKSMDRLGFYITTGVAALLGVQVLINVAVVTSSMPATGITLPFVSYGGTSIWVFMAAIGVALNVAKQSKAQTDSTYITKRRITEK